MELRRGDFERVHSDDDAMLFAFRRTVGEESLLVVINRGDQPYAGSLGETAQALADADRERIFTTWTPSPENQATTAAPSSSPEIRLPPRSGAVYRERARVKEGEG